MRFEVKTELSKEDFNAYYWLNQKVHARFAYILGRVFGIAAVVLLIVLVGTIAVYRLWDDLEVIRPFGIFVLLLIVWPLVNRYLVSQAYKANSSALKGVYRFGDDELQHEQNEMSGKFAYSAFKELYHSGSAYYIYIDKAHAIVLPERCFTQGDPAAFGRFMAEKTGLTVKEIN